MSTSGKRIAIGLDVGGTRIKAVALDESHAILDKYEGPSEAQHGPDAVREAMRLAIAHFPRTKLILRRLESDAPAPSNQLPEPSATPQISPTGETSP